MWILYRIYFVCKLYYKKITFVSRYMTYETYNSIGLLLSTYIYK